MSDERLPSFPCPFPPPHSPLPTPHSLLPSPLTAACCLAMAVAVWSCVVSAQQQAAPRELTAAEREELFKLRQDRMAEAHRLRQEGNLAEARSEEHTSE